MPGTSYSSEPYSYTSFTCMRIARPNRAQNAELPITQQAGILTADQVHDRIRAGDSLRARTAYLASRRVGTIQVRNDHISPILMER